MRLARRPIHHLCDDDGRHDELKRAWRRDGFVRSSQLDVEATRAFATASNGRPAVALVCCFEVLALIATRRTVSCWQLNAPVAHLKREACGPHRHLNSERNKGEEANEGRGHDSKTIVRVLRILKDDSGESHNGCGP